jgi:hypothetical protein
MSSYDFGANTMWPDPISFFVGLAVFAIIGGVIAAVEKHRRS